MYIEGCFGYCVLMLGCSMVNLYCVDGGFVLSVDDGIGVYVLLYVDVVLFVMGSEF